MLRKMNAGELLMKEQQDSPAAQQYQDECCHMDREKAAWANFSEAPRKFLASKQSSVSTGTRFAFLTTIAV